MPTPVSDLIHCHGSVRRYRPDSVPTDTIEAIIVAGQRASTSANLQLTSVVAVTEATTRGLFSELCGDQAHIAQAPVVLEWCADLIRLDRACELRGIDQVTDYVENFLVAAVDVAIAAQNAEMAANLLTDTRSRAQQLSTTDQRRPDVRFAT